MDFKFGEKEEKLRKEIREWVKKEIPEGQKCTIFDEETFDDEWDYALKTSKKLADKKWLTISWPKEYGGLGASHWERAVWEEEVGYWSIPGTTMGVSGVGWVGPSLVLFGTEEQKKKYMPLIANGETDGIWCTGYSEPDAGTDFANIRTKAEKDGDHYIINGQKVWTSCAHRAKYYWLAVKTDPNAKKKHEGISLIIVDMKSEGVIVNPIISYAGHHILNEVFLDNVKVPKENLVGEEGNGWNMIMQALAFERGALGINMYGADKRLLEELIEYCKETGLIKKTEVRHKLAELAMDIETLKLGAHQTIDIMDKGGIPVQEPCRDKAFHDRLLRKFSTFGSEILGDYSSIDPVARDKKWAKLQSSIEKMFTTLVGAAAAQGTIETQKNIIGQFGLGLPRSY